MRCSDTVTVALTRVVERDLMAFREEGVNDSGFGAGEGSQGDLNRLDQATENTPP